MKSFTRVFAATAVSLSAAGAFAAGSLSVSRELVVDRSPETVWKLLGEFNSLDVWLPPVVRSSFSGSPRQPGAVRVLELGGDASVTERLLAYDAVQHAYSYAFLKSPLPVANYVALIEVRPAGDGKALVRWSSTFDAAGAPDQQAKDAILGIYDAGLGKLGSIFRQ